MLLAGPSGVGKSTVLGAVSGLVPHFTGGTLRGRVTVAGRDTRTHKPRELADVVGTVGQDPCPTSSRTRSRTSSPTAWSRSAWRRP
ncbi:ATP-binding cassette domain-containing protein [Streptomyces sp. PAN_FS17]|uniref:ATP-binding cassette domain-containing protein n=1 Tax=Streptomyces sp. PAN_FS17 TaxID=1855351 RepID=UPI0035276FAF